MGMDRRLRGRSVKGAGGVGHEDLNSHRPRELGAQRWAAVAGWGYREDSSWRSLISSEHNQRCIHRFTIHNLQYTTSPTRLPDEQVVLVPHQMDTRRRCDDGLVICTQSNLYCIYPARLCPACLTTISCSPPIPRHTDWHLHWHLAPGTSHLLLGDMMSRGHVLGTRWHSPTAL